MSENEQISPVTEVEETRPVSAENNKVEKKEVKNKKDKKFKKSKDKKPGKVATALKETKSELKKVTWPSFGKVVKQTGVVIAVVAIFLVAITLMDLGLTAVLDLLVG